MTCACSCHVPHQAWGHEGCIGSEQQQLEESEPATTRGHRGPWRARCVEGLREEDKDQVHEHWKSINRIR